MIQEFFCPIKTIEKAKKNKDIKDTILTLLIASLMFAIATIILFSKVSTATELSIMALVTSIVYFVMAFIGAFLYNFLINVIAGKGKYRHSLVAVVQTALIISAGFLLTTLLMLIPLIGPLLGLIMLFLTIITGLAIFIRAMTTLTGANTTQVLTILLIMLIGTIMATQLVLLMELIREPITTSALNTTPDELFMLDFNNVA